MGTHTYFCPRCEGEGCIYWNNGPVYIGGRDPQWDEDCECPDCDGDGWIECDQPRDDLHKWSPPNRGAHLRRGLHRIPDPLNRLCELRLEALKMKREIPGTHGAWRSRNHWRLKLTELAKRVRLPA